MAEACRVPYDVLAWTQIHFADQGLSTYTHVSDQHSTFGTKVIVPTTREAHYVLDDFLGNATDLPIREHAADMHGVTLINFALFDLVGKASTPRIRDLGKITLCRDDTPTVINARYPHAGPLLSTRLNADLIVGTWPDLLRMAGSLKFGEATASLIVGEWSAASRQNTLAAALKEWAPGPGGDQPCDGALLDQCSRAGTFQRRCTYEYVTLYLRVCTVFA